LREVGYVILLQVVFCVEILQLPHLSRVVEHLLPTWSFFNKHLCLIGILLFFFYIFRHQIVNLRLTFM
jgi:hypothetical protein